MQHCMYMYFTKKAILECLVNFQQKSDTIPYGVKGNVNSKMYRVSKKMSI